MDQFTYADSIFEQMSRERYPVPTWIVMSAGTGDTTATLGRYIHYKRFATRLCVAGPEYSAFFEGFAKGNARAISEKASRIEGISRPRVEPSFVPNVIDRMLRIAEFTSWAAMRVLSRQLGRKVGGLTGTNFFALRLLASRMRADGLKGSLVSLICNSGERYGHTYYNDDWIAAQGFDLSSSEAALEDFLQSGEPLL